MSKTRTKLSFQNDYYSDLTFPDMLYAGIIRSQIEKGIVKSVYIDNLPDGYHIFKAMDVPGKNIIDTPLGKVPIFSTGNISYLGEPLGILVGPDEEKVQELLSNVKVDWDNKPIESYLADLNILTEKKKRSEDLFSTVLASRKVEYGPSYKTKKAGGINSVFEKCHKVVQECWTYNLHNRDNRETNGAICKWDGENMLLFTPTLWLSYLRATLCDALNIKTENILVNKTKSFSAGTNSVWYNSIIACQVAIASYHTKKPVKLVYSRKEQNCFMESALPLTITHKSGVDENGKLLAMQIDIDVDAGAYNPFAREIIDRLIIASTGPYEAENLCITATAFSSLNPPSSLDLQLMDAAAFFAVENQMNLLTRQLETLLPGEIRTLNFQNDESAKKSKTPYPFQFELLKPVETLNALLTKNNFNMKYGMYEYNSRELSLNFEDPVSIKPYPLRGIGLSCAFEGSGYYGSDVYGNDLYIETTLEKDGSVTIHTAPVSTSIYEIWKDIASETLNKTRSQIKLSFQFEAEEEPPMPENVYNNISVMTELLEKCLDTIKHLKSDVELPYTVKKRISSTKKNEWSKEDFSGKPFHDTSFAAATVEVEVDQWTFRETIREINLVFSCGRLLNEKSAKATVLLGVQKVLSSLIKDETIPSPKINISFMQSDDKPSKVGELVYHLIPAAYTQALSQALNCTISKVPLSTSSIFDCVVQQKEMKEISLKALKERNSASLQESVKQPDSETDTKANSKPEKKGEKDADNTDAK